MLRDTTRSAALAALHAYASDIRAEIERRTREMAEELARVEGAIASLSGESDVSSLDQVRPSSAPSGAYWGMGPQHAVETFLRDHPNQAFRPNEIAMALKAGGFRVPNPDLANQQVTIALVRAVKKGIAAEGKRGDKRTFTFAASPRSEPEATSLP